ncbi:MAG: TIGR03663 family protein [Candidatus Methanoperedens sp.]|nr:TIGR03663 family protein [Candidatus Methanoperedens sp.]
MNKRNFAFYTGFFIIIAFAFFLRLYRLDERVFHHDEAAVGYFAYKLFSEHSYTYDPAFHGPFMYYATTEIFKRLGDSVYSARFLPAILGSAMLFFLIPLRKYIGNRGMLICAFFLAFTPSFLYYSRFYREDIFMSFFSLLLLVCIIKFVESYSNVNYSNDNNILSGFSFLRFVYIIIGALALASLAALKENAYIIMALLSFFLFLLVIREKSYVGLMEKIKCRDKKIFIIFAEILFFIFIFIVFFSLYYTGNLFNITGMKEAFMKAVLHWYEMHKIERMGGPFFFYLPIMVLYELPIFVFGILGILYYGCRENNKKKVLKYFLIYWIIVDILYLISKIYPASNPFLPVSYIPSSIIVFFPLLIYAILTVLRSKDIFVAFLIYWTLTNFFVYSYIQEKVPWLVLNPLLSLTIIAAIYMNKIIPDLKLNSRNGIITLIIIIVTSSFFVYSGVELNFKRYTDPAEPLIQAAQPPQKYALFLDKINEISMQYEGNSTRIQVTDGEMETQFLWYMRHYDNVQWKVDINSTLDAPLIVVHDGDEAESEADIVRQNMRIDYERLDSAKMSWYWFKESDLTLDYLLYRKMDREPSEYRIVLFYKPKFQES